MEEVREEMSACVREMHSLSREQLLLHLRLLLLLSHVPQSCFHCFKHGERAVQLG